MGINFDLFKKYDDVTALNRFIITLIATLFVGGCSAVPIANPNATAEKFIIEQNITSVWKKLNASSDHDYFVWYQGGTQNLNSEEQTKLLSWIKSHKPEMICLRGTGGSEEFRSLAEIRVLGVIGYLQAQHVGVDIVKLRYDPSIRGGRVLINKLSPQLAEEIISTAPILVIESD